MVGSAAMMVFRSMPLAAARWSRSLPCAKAKSVAAAAWFMRWSRMLGG